MCVWCVWIDRSIFVIQNLLAFFLYKRALLVPGTATFAVRQSDPFVFSIVFQSKIAATHVTVHTTWCNQFRLQIINPVTINVLSVFLIYFRRMEGISFVIVLWFYPFLGVPFTPVFETVRNHRVFNSILCREIDLQV